MGVQLVPLHQRGFQPLGQPLLRFWFPAKPQRFGPLCPMQVRAIAAPEHENLVWLKLPRTPNAEIDEPCLELDPRSDKLQCHCSNPFVLMLGLAFTVLHFGRFEHVAGSDLGHFP